MEQEPILTPTTTQSSYYTPSVTPDFDHEAHSYEGWTPKVGKIFNLNVPDNIFSFPEILRVKCSFFTRDNRLSASICNDPNTRASLLEQISFHLTPLQSHTTQWNFNNSKHPDLFFQCDFNSFVNAPTCFSLNIFNNTIQTRIRPASRITLLASTRMLIHPRF